MILFHYFKVAFRNHLQHKTQSVISLFSLAIAFACVSLAIYWNHYEQTYDSFLTHYDRIYQVGYKGIGDTQIRDYSITQLPLHLMNNYVEVDKACGMWSEWEDERMVEIGNHSIHTGCTKITPEAVDMFEIQWLEGNGNMESWNENQVAVSEQIACQVSENKSPVGLKLILKKEDGIETEDEYQIAAVFKTWPQHSNFKFGVVKRMPVMSTGEISLCNTYVMLKPGVDSDVFLQKMTADTLRNFSAMNTYNVITPLKEVHYTFPKEKRNIRLDDVKLFAGAAVLLLVCALLNYLMLFVSRLRNRGRDMALRTVCGSSSWQTGMLLIVEYLLLLFGALFLSTLFIELVSSSFVELAQLTIDRSTIYVGCGYLLLFILALATVLSLVPILYFKRKTLRVQMDSVPVQSGASRFRMAGVCVQLFISLLFIFCATIMIKQVHCLLYDDIHIQRKNIAMISSPIGDDRIMDLLRQIPLISEMVPTFSPVFPSWNVNKVDIKGFDGKDEPVIPAWEVSVNRDIANFYGMQMKEGAESFDLKMDEYLINETFAKQLNDPNPIGKTFPHFFKGVIKGIVQDFQFQPPTEPVRALYFRQHWNTDRSTPYGVVNQTVAFKYTGDFAACESAIEKAFEDVEIDNSRYDKYLLLDGETVYNSYLTSEFNLLKLLNIITVISLLIALFGVYALILQECERQRKNIAIRKVYGAQVKDILMMFFKEYMLQVAIAASVAFPIGYVLMKGWLEGYSRQTGVGIGVFLGIFVGMSVLVSLCIGWHVWKAANENPATAVKKE